jgi:hypothetical protein
MAINVPTRMFPLLANMRDLLFRIAKKNICAFLKMNNPLYSGWKSIRTEINVSNLIY